MPAEPSHICAQPLLDPIKTWITATAAAAKPAIQSFLNMGRLVLFTRGANPGPRVSTHR